MDTLVYPVSGDGKLESPTKLLTLKITIIFQPTWFLCHSENPREVLIFKPIVFKVRIWFIELHKNPENFSMDCGGRKMYAIPTLRGGFTLWQQ